MTESKTLFGKKPTVEEKPEIDNSISNNINRRIRVLEERFQNLAKKQQVTEENMLETNKDHETQLKRLTQEVEDLSKKYLALRDRLQDMGHEIDSKAAQQEFLVVKKYLELWKPVNFVSEQTVERLINEKLKAKKGK